MSQYITDLKKCKTCGEVKHVSEYYKTSRGYTRQPCKECWNERKRGGKYADTGYSSCTNCPKLEECRELTGTMVLVDGEYEHAPLPCDNGYKPPQSARWEFGEKLVENGVTHATQ